MGDPMAWSVVIVGAGGFGREVFQYVLDTFPSGTHAPSGFVDDRPDPTRLKELGWPYLGTVTSFVPRDDDRLVVAIGEPRVRLRVARSLAARGARFLTLVHPRAYVAASARIGEGSVIAPFACVGAGAVLGEHVQVHFCASAAHDTIIGDGAALSPYAAVNGGAVLGEGVFLGTRATINPLKQVGAFAKIAAGSVVYRDVPAAALVAGNPAKARVLGFDARLSGSGTGRAGADAREDEPG